MRPAVIHTFNERRVWTQRDNPFSLEERLPLTMVLVHGESWQVPVPIMAIVDTGAQHLMLPADIAPDINLDLSACEQRPVVIASGEVTHLPCAMVEITVRKVRARVLAYFGAGWNQPLLGIEAIYATMTFGVDRAGSLYGTPRQSGGLVSEVIRYLQHAWGSHR